MAKGGAASPVNGSEELTGIHVTCLLALRLSSQRKRVQV